MLDPAQHDLDRSSPIRFACQLPRHAAPESGVRLVKPLVGRRGAPQNIDGVGLKRSKLHATFYVSRTGFRLVSRTVRTFAALCTITGILTPLRRQL